MKAMLNEPSLAKGGGAFEHEKDEDELSGGFMSSGEDEDINEDDRDEKMEEIMEQMDRELGVTEVGKSFEKIKVSLQRC